MMSIKHTLLGLLSVAALASCSIQEELQPTASRRHFRAVLEQSSTRAYSDQSFHFFWNADDRVSIFEGSTSNLQYYFAGDNGETAGDFLLVGDAPSGSAPAIVSGYSYSIYPYSEDNGCDPQGTLTVVFPEQQPMFDKGIGLRPLMAARSNSGDNYYFKHLGAYVGVRLVGDGVTVASISFQSNNSEALSGPASVTFADDGLPVVALDQEQGGSSITMTLGTPVALDAEEAKVFWLNIPACSLSGYTLTIMDPDGGIFQKVRTTPLTLERAKTYDLDATVEITPVPLDEHSYTKASTITAGGTYLVVDATDDQRVFKGAKDGSYVSVSPENDIITDTDGSLAAYEFTVEQSGSNYYLKFNDGNYLVCDYSNSGNTTTGIRYVATQDLVDYPYSLTIVDGVFFFSTTQINNGSTDQILYYKPINAPNSGTDRFKIGGTGSDYGVHLYMKGGKRARGLKFEPEEVICLEGNVPEKPVLSGTYTTLTWTSENTAVATVDGNGEVTIVGIGTTTITAEAEEDTYYQTGSASYTLTVLDSDTASYVKAAAITVGGTYLIVDVADQRLFKGATDGTYLNVSPENGIIIDYDRTLSAYEFTVEQNGSNYYLKFNDGKYLVCDYSNGDGQSGLCYVETQAAVKYPYALTTSNGAFMFSTTQVSSTSSTNQVLYYKPAEAGGTGPDRFKIGGSGRTIGVHLYLKGGKQDRGLKFEPTSVTCLQGNTPEKPVLSGTYTSVRYSSDNTSVATVNATNGTVTVTGIGMATITASVDADDDYMAGTASYTLTVLDPNGSTYTKVSSITVGGTYLIVDATDDQRVFKGAKDGSYVSVSPSGGVITDVNRTLGDYEFTVEQSEKGYYLKFNDGNYLICDYSSSGNTTTGIRYVATQDKVDYPYSLTVTDGVFFFSTTKIDSGTPGQILYYKPSNAGGNGTNRFKIGETGSGYGVHLYLKGGSGGTPAKLTQTISFSQPTVTWTLGQGYELNGSYALPQTVTDNNTSVTYTSETPEVVTFSNNLITIVAAGSATIKATAAETDEYYGATTTFTLNIATPAPEGWVDLKSFDLENAALKAYLNEAERTYLDDNEQTVTCVQKYVSQYSTITRQDCPAPAVITWTNPASSNTVVTIYTDEDLSQKFLSPVNASENATSVDVYNLIPGRKYYYTVSENGTIWEKGYFNTTGRRRMLKISDTKAEGHANNCRDLGGMVTKDGTKRIKYGYIFRGSNMDKTTSTEKSILYNDLNIRVDVDLRSGSGSPSAYSESGSGSAYNAFSRSQYSMDYYNVGFSSFNDIKSDPTRVKNVVNKIIDTVVDGSSAVYFHCYVGADRTGFFGLLIEGLLGISEADCSMDYELTSFSVVGLRGRDGSGQDHYWGSSRSDKGLALLRSQTGDTFEQKCTNYLTSIGVSDSKIAAFKRTILESINNNN